jgi:CRP-like cAMP-binding protein
MRFVPYLRDDDKIGLEELKKLEVHFTKVELSKGYQVIQQGQKDDHIYYLFKGQCRLLLSTQDDATGKIFPLAVKERSS